MVLEVALPAKVLALDRPTPLFDRYLPLKSMQGGMGVVHLCADLAERRPVALKTIRPELLADPESRELFLREASVWVTLGSHPHIVSAQQVRRDREQVYVVADYVAPVEGAASSSLRHWTGEPVATGTALHFALGIARGMTWAVQQVPGLVHRDLKPENVLVGRDYRARVTDFGLATVKGRGARGPCGTPAYMAPEQWDGAADVRSDIYAFGLIVLELITGTTGVHGRTVGELEAAHRAGAAARHAAAVALPPSLSTLVQSAVHPDRSQRPPDWHVVEDVLVKAWIHETGAAPPDLPDAPRATRDRRVLDGWSHNALANALSELGQLRDAADGYRAVVRTAMQEADRSLEAAALGNLGQTLAAMGALDEALDNLEASLAIKRATGDRLGQANSLNNRANVLARRNRPAEALADYQAAAELFAALGRAADQVAARFNMVPVLARLGQGDQALAIAHECRDAFRAAGDLRGEGAALGTLGQILRRKGQLDHAYRCSEDAIACFRAAADRLGEARELSFQGHTLRAMGRMDEAMERFQLSLRLSNEIGDKLLTGSNLYALAQMTPPMPQLAQLGREYAQLAAAVYREVGREDLAADAEELARQFGAGA